MMYEKSLAEVQYEEMRIYQRFLASLRFKYDEDSSSRRTKNVLKRIKHHREMWRAASDS